jgi:ketosteroid isomerase-like protein
VEAAMNTGDHEARFGEFLAAVPSNVERSHIESVVNRYMASYRTRDVETRISLFAEELCFEDPVGHHLASNKAELKKFFESTIATGVSLRFFPERLVVVGDEALQIAKLLIEHGETDTTLLLLYLHFVFGADGFITSVRVFFDANCESKPI